MIELPKGVWSWITANTKDLARIAKAAERIADELAEIRQLLESNDEKEQK